MATKEKPQPRPGELPEEFGARRALARCQLRAALAYEKQQKASIKEMASLSSYRAAKKDRRNRDWTLANSSADLAIIPDSLTLVARARQLVRDFPLAKSAVRAFKRNVAGNGIQVNPHAKDAGGKPLEKFNVVASLEWSRWANDKRACHVEGVQNFRQIQRLAAAERFTVGEHLLMWSYSPPTRATGRIDKSRPCGLQLQGFEPEQLDLRIISYEGREIRGGVEIDENYRPTAYHVYSRNPWDVLYRHAFFSIRVDAGRMFHYMEHDRVLQSRGELPLACVMQTLRDLERFNAATLTRAMMEACIGILIKTNMPVAPPGLLGGSANGGCDTGPGWGDEGEMAPGMIGKLRPGEDVNFIDPATPGSQYPPFIQMNTRMAGAGIGMSYGQVMRENNANYSAARQDMLEDRKEYEPEQSLLIDSIIAPTYERFLTFAAQEGRFDGVPGFDLNDFNENRWRYIQADYVPPPMTWIDPEKEANAYSMLLRLNLITREEIAAQRGKKFMNIVLKKAGERKAMIGAGLQVVEDEADILGKRDVVKSYLASRDTAVAATAVNQSDIAGQIEDAGLAVRAGEDQKDLPTDVPAPGAPGTPQAAPPPKPTNGTPVNGAEKPKQARAARRVSLSVRDVPHYRMSGEPDIIDCASCSFASGRQCTKYDFIYEPKFVCDSWAAGTLTEEIGAPATSKTFPPMPRDGEPNLESQFWPAADRLKGIPGFSEQ